MATAEDTFEKSRYAEEILKIQYMASVSLREWNFAGV